MHVCTGVMVVSEITPQTFSLIGIFFLSVETLDTLQTAILAFQSKRSTFWYLETGMTGISFTELVLGNRCVWMWVSCEHNEGIVQDRPCIVPPWPLYIIHYTIQVYTKQLLYIWHLQGASIKTGILDLRLLALTLISAN